MSKEKVDKFFLVFNPVVFVERELLKSRRLLELNKIIFVFLNLLSMVGTLFVTSLTIMTFSKIYWSIGTWFYFTTTGISAVIVLFTSLTNLFYVRSNIQKYSKRVDFIYAEIIRYESKAGDYKFSRKKDFLIFQKVAKYIDYRLAEEVDYE